MKAPTSLSTLEPGFMTDPYPVYERLRAEGPVVWSRPENAWLLSGHADVAAVLADPGFEVVDLSSVIGGLGEASGRPVPDLQSVMRAVLFLRNPPEHTVERRYLAAVMTAQPVSAYAPLIRGVARDLAARMAARSVADAATDYADRLPPLVMAALLGLTAEQVAFLMEVVFEVSRGFDRGRSLRFYQRVDAGAAKGRALFKTLIAERRAHPGDDGLSRMIALSDEKHGLDDDDIASRALFLIIAGAETTSALIGNAIGAVLESGEPAWAAPDLAERAVEEVLRYDPPAQQATRIAREPRVVAGQAIQPGERLVMLLGAAHRDPTVYEAPDRFDPARSGPPHLAFGAGRHFCLGSNLAKLEARIALTELFAYRPRLASQDRTWWEHRTIRRPLTLPITLDGAPS